MGIGTEHRHWLIGMSMLLLAVGTADRCVAQVPASDQTEGAAVARVKTPTPGEVAVQDEDMPESLARLYRRRGRRTDRELSEIRERRAGYFERESPRILAQLEPLTVEARRATFEVIDGDGYWVAMGCVIHPDGYALTKASTLENSKEVKCRFGKDNNVTAKVEKYDAENDVALLKLEPGNYTFVSIKDQEPTVGTICLSVGVRDALMAMGTCSVTSRSLQERRQPILGVEPRPAEQGILVLSSDGAARQAGIQNGDVITKFAGQSVSEVPQFVNLIRRYQAGEEVIVTTLRNNRELEFTVRLGGRSIGRMAPRFEAMNLLGSINSKRRSDFPWVMQHDTPLMPEQCGGVLLDLEGNAIGLNIARGGRIMSYAISGAELKRIIDQFEITPMEKQPAVAAQ